MNDFAAEVRGAARALLPDRAFLRRDRGEGLFVTNAPRLEPGVDWPAKAKTAGFEAALRGSLMVLSPGAVWAARLEARFPEPPDFLCGSLFRFAGLASEGGALRLFANGLRILDGGEGVMVYDRQLRQLAAAALREGRGAGLYACALVLYLIKEAE